MRKKIPAWLLSIMALGMASVVGCGGSSPNGPATTPGASTSNPAVATAGGAGQSCLTVATKQHSVQTFADGRVVTTDTSCAFQDPADVLCSDVFVDSEGGPGTGTQTTHFDAKADIIAEGAVNPPPTLALETTTVLTVSGTSFTTTATNSYDAHKRLAQTTITNPPPLGGESTLTYSDWDSAGRPTAGTESLGSGPSGPISFTYDDAAHTVKRNIPPNICTDTYDQNGIMTGEDCTGTTPSKTVVTTLATQQICN